MLQLLCKENFPFKTEKITIFEKSDSGETIWFASFKAIIEEDNVVDIVDEGRFAMKMVNEDTACIFMDGWNTGFTQISLFSVIYAHYYLYHVIVIFYFDTV